MYMQLGVVLQVLLSNYLYRCQFVRRHRVRKVIKIVKKRNYQSCTPYYWPPMNVCVIVYQISPFMIDQYMCVLFY